jgi:hypothetical protein
MTLKHLGANQVDSIHVRNDLKDPEHVEAEEEKFPTPKQDLKENQCYICDKVFMSKQGWKRHIDRITTDPITKRAMCVSRGNRKSILPVSLLLHLKSPNTNI